MRFQNLEGAGLLIGSVDLLGAGFSRFWGLKAQDLFNGLPSFGLNVYRSSILKFRTR